MAVIFQRFDQQQKEMVDIGVLIDNEIHGDESIPARGLNLDADGIEDHVVKIYSSRTLNAVKVPDDEVDIDDYQ